MFLLAHCAAGSPHNITVRAGSSFRSSGGVILSVNQTIVHPGYKIRTLENDVAVLRLNESLIYSAEIQAIVLNCDQEVSNGTECSVSGWGMTDDGSFPEQIREVRVQTMNRVECQRNYNSAILNFTVPSTSLCAGVQDGGKDSCTGDSVS